jgi:outer membrane lipoprotein-sorting protein
MRRSLASLLFLLYAAAALGQEPLPPGLKGADKLAALVQRVSQVQGSMASLRSRFEQEKKSHLLLEPSVSRGHFYFLAPDNVRWDYESPRAMTVVLSGGVALTYRPLEKRAERVEVGRAQRRVFRFVSAAEPLEKLKQYFSFTFMDPGDDSNYTLILRPTSHVIAKRLKNLELEIDSKRMIPVVVSYAEADGDTTTYRFTDIEINKPVDKALFHLDLPPDVEVVTLKVGSGE